MKNFFLLCTVCFLQLVAITSQAQLRGRVVAIADGDTFTLLVGREEVRIRLHGIDCPERSQAFGQAARQRLSDLLYQKAVSVQKLGEDRYGRTIGLVTLDDGRIVNEILLEEGLAWHYKRYDSNDAWATLENDARKNKKGLWKDTDPVPPWEFRRNY